MSDTRVLRIGIASRDYVKQRTMDVCRATIKVRHVVNQGETAPGWTAVGRA